MINYVEEFRSFSSCEVADALYALELLPCQVQQVRLLSPGHPYDLDCKIVGHAHVAKFVRYEELTKSPVDRQFVDTCPFNSVAVLQIPDGTVSCNWGGLLTARAKFLGLSGAIVDGNIRDLAEIREMKFPVFAKGTGVHGAKGFTTLERIGGSVELSGGVTVTEGDLILADINGVVVVPKGELEEVWQKTRELVKCDSKCMEDLQQGVSLQEAFKRHRTQPSKSSSS